MKFSIIMPTCNPNRAKIEEAVESVRAQSEDYELIIVENGSGKSLADTVKEWNDSHIRYYSLEEANVSRARNYAVRNSTGDMLCFLDDDDVLDQDALSFYRRALVETNADVLLSKIGHYEKREEKKNFLCHQTDEKEREIIIRGIFNQKENVSGIYGVTGECVVRKSFLVERGMAYREDETFEEDQTFIVALLTKAKNVTVLDESVYLYRRNKKSKKKDIGNAIFERYYQHLKIALMENRVVSKQEMNAYVIKTYMKYKSWTCAHDSNLDDRRIDRIRALLKDPDYKALYKIRKLYTVLWLMDLNIGCYKLTRWIIDKKGL